MALVKPRKPDLNGEQLWLYLMRKGDDDSTLAFMDYAQVELERANPEIQDEDGDIDYADNYWDENSISISRLSKLIAKLPSDVEWTLHAEANRDDRDHGILALSGYKTYSAKEKKERQAKYEADLIAYEKAKVEQQKAKEARVLANKKKKLEQLKKELKEK